MTILHSMLDPEIADLHFPLSNKTRFKKNDKRDLTRPPPGTNVSKMAQDLLNELIRILKLRRQNEETKQKRPEK